MESILNSIKKLLGMTSDYTCFDKDLIIHINTVFAILTQLGVGPETGFSISDNSAIWNDFTSDMKVLESVKSYMYLKVRLLFDPPTSSFVMESMNRQIAEFEWRLNVEAEHGNTE